MLLEKKILEANMVIDYYAYILALMPKKLL